MPQILSIPISLKGNYKRFASTYGSLNFMVRLVTEETREKTRDAVEKCNLKMFDSLPIFVIFILFVSNRSNLARKFENIIFNFPEISQQPNRG